MSHRRTHDVTFAVRFRADFPDEHNGNIVGLAEKSIRWHRGQQRDGAQQIADNYGAETKVAAPPIELPPDPQVRFLATVGDICDESEAMRHCVRSYVPMAVEGDAYLFHAENYGEQATVEVSRSGQVTQTAGPGNERNRAATWGGRVLKKWGRTFPPQREPVLSAPGFEYEIPF